MRGGADRRVLAHAGFGQKFLDGVLRGEGFQETGGELDVRGDHGPDGAGYADLPDILDLRGGK